jgi:glycosyltransferase involved in cell wall biosynthesis
LSKVLIFGHAPLPWEDLTRSYGPGTRTWQFAKPLIADGHEVTVLASRIPYVYPDEEKEVTRGEENGCVIYRIDQDEFEIGGITDRLMQEIDPDCVVGATAYPSYVGVTYAGERPVWVDVFGSFLSEAQAKAAVYNDNSFLSHFVRIISLLVNLGDMFSTVSERQKYELIGQLGVAGRLNAETFGYDFVCPIPCGVEELSFPPAVDPTGGKGEDAFIILWSGGFNTWTDVRTLYNGMEFAMAASPRVHFVSTGGDIRGHDERTYAEFERMVAASKYRDRFHLKGWVKRSEALSYYGAASVGINIDARHYEVTFGSRNRILEWALAGLPAISTDLCELTGELSGEGLLFPVPVGEPRALAERVVGLEKDRDELRRAGEGLRTFVLERYSFEETTRRLRDWVKHPEHAPDFDERVRLRRKALEKARRFFMPPITPDSPVAEKVKFYLKSEGLFSTLKRSATFMGKRSRRE